MLRYSIAMEINILVDDSLTDYPDSAWLESLLEQVLIAQNAGPEAEIGLVITTQEKIHQLNLKYLEEDKPTDVLSFPMLAEPSGNGTIQFVAAPDGQEHLGEVIISYPQTIIQAEERHHPVNRELAILLIHGVLHLLGYDHDLPEPERLMKEREADILYQVEEKL